MGWIYFFAGLIVFIVLLVIIPAMILSGIASEQEEKYCDGEDFTYWD